MIYSISWLQFSLLALGLAAGNASAIPAENKGHIATLVDAADIIVIGTARSSALTASGARYSLFVSKYIKGDAGSSALTMDVPVSRDPRMGDPRAGIDCAIWFLRKNEQDWIAMQSGGLPGIWGFYYSAPSCDISIDAQRSPLDTVISILGSAVEASQGKDFSASLLFRGVRAEDSHLARELASRFRQSPYENVQLLGLAMAILQGDSTALTGLQERSKVLMNALKRNTADIATAVGAYTGADPRGIEALGRIAEDRANPLVLCRAAAYALRNIHTRETIPYLARLLDDTDLRHIAVSGFVYYKLKLPVLGGESRPDIVVEKATREYAMSNPDPVERQAMRLGPVEDPAESQRIADYWKSWFQGNQALLDFQ